MDSSLHVETRELSSFDSFIPNTLGIYSKSQGGVGELLVLDDEKGELVKEPASSRKKVASQIKNAAAVRNHCEAERRRRERINGHLATLRNFVHCADKLDKATLLAQVISQIKVLKRQAREATKGLLMPADADEVIVEPCRTPYGDFAIRASLCCDYNPELIFNVRQAIENLKLNILRAEISTLGSRVKSLFIIKGEVSDGETGRLGKSIHEALRRILEKISASEEYSMFSNKRRRVSSPMSLLVSPSS